MSREVAHLLACPRWRYPFGSGGNLVTTFRVSSADRSSEIILEMKFCGYVRPVREAEALEEAMEERARGSLRSSLKSRDVGVTKGEVIGTRSARIIRSNMLTKG